MMRQLALAHFLEEYWNTVEGKLLRSHQVSEALIMVMARMSKEHKVHFMVAASVDLNVSGYLNLPHDYHPSAAANRMYAAKLETAIRSELSLPVPTPD